MVKNSLKALLAGFMFVVASGSIHAVSITVSIRLWNPNGTAYSGPTITVQPSCESSGANIGGSYLFSDGAVHTIGPIDTSSCGTSNVSVTLKFSGGSSDVVIPGIAGTASTVQVIDVVIPR